MIGLLLPLVLIGIIVWIVRSSSGSDLAGDRTVGSLRNFLQYSFLAAALFTAASGVSRLLLAALPANTIAGRPTVDLAMGLSLTIVATPLWVVLWRLVASRLVQDPAERSAPAWAGYLVVVATTTLIVAYVNVIDVGRWIVGVEEYQPSAVASAVVWSGVWISHAWLLQRPRLAATHPLSQLAVLAGSVIGLVGIAVGTSQVVRYAFGQVYGSVAGPVLVEGVTPDDLRSGVVVTAVGAPVWWWHWLRQGARGPRSLFWHAYLMLVGVLGGLLTAVTSLGLVLHAFLQWLFGVPEVARAAVHFEPLPAELAAVVVGVWTWWYHRAVLGDAPERRRTEPERVYEYLVAGVGLIAAASGATVAIMAAIQAITPGALATTDPAGRNTLVVAVTLLIVGTPLWWVFWHRLQVHTTGTAGVNDGRGMTDGGAVDDAAELSSPSRRVYLFVLFAVAALVAVVSLAIILYTVFRDSLEATLNITVLHDLRAAVGLLVTAGALSAYHWTVHRADRRMTPVPQGRGPSTVVLVSPDGRELAAAVAAGTGATVRRLRRLDTVPGPVDAAGVTAAVLESAADRVLVMVDADGAVHVIPYDTA